MTARCVFNARRTNEELEGPERVGRPHGLIVMSWCGDRRSTSEWLFTGAEHVLDSLEAGSSVTPCRACLRAMLDVIVRELNSR